MFKNLKLAQKLILGFALVLLVSTVVTGFGIVYMRRIADSTETMYTHSYMAHTHALNIQVKITSMASTMKDIVVAGSRTTREEYIAVVEELHQEALVDFDELYKSFLGDRAVIDVAVQAFADWEATRQEIYAELDLGHFAVAADLSRNKMAEEVALLQSYIQQVVDEAQVRAERFNRAARQNADSATNTVVGLLILAVVAAVVATVLITRSITRPIAGLLTLTNEIASGNLAAADVDYRSRDEIGRLTEALNKMKRELHQMVSSVKEAVGIVRTSAEQMSTGAQENSASVQELASSTNELANAADRLSDNTQQMSNLANRTNELAEQGSEDIKRTVQSMQGINEVVTALASEIRDLGQHSEEIGKMVALITGIADQTNLLALNAAIEAARAGDKGRGFAVVAEEVRHLAEQSAQAAGEITQLVRRIRESVQASVDRAGEGTRRVHEGIDVVGHTGGMFAQIADTIKSLTQGIAEIAATSEELAAGAEEMGATTEQQSASTQHMAQSAVEVAKAAETLDSHMSRFQV